MLTDSLPSSISKAFNRAAQRYESYAVLQRQMAIELNERCAFFNIKPDHILDVGAGTGLLTLQLQQRYPQSRVVALDIAWQMLRQLQSGASAPPLLCGGDAHRLPIRDQCFHLVGASAVFQWSYNLGQLVRELHRVMHPEGLLIFATFGPNTLSELRLAWEIADPGRAHINDFMDMHDLGDLFVHNGFDDLVVDADTVSMSYQDWQSAYADVRGVGSRNHLPDRRRGLTSPRRWQRMVGALMEMQEERGVEISYEVIYGHCFKSRPGERRQPAVVKLEDVTRLSAAPSPGGVES